MVFRVDVAFRVKIGVGPCREAYDEPVEPVSLARELALVDIGPGLRS